jgi:hypothetical protein
MVVLLPLAQLLTSQGLFNLIVKGGVIGLAASVLILLAIWAYEWRQGKIW